MAAWFKSKSKTSSSVAPQSGIARAVHTMKDDLAGNAPVESVAIDPLVAFQPDQAAGSVPFYAAPGALAEPEQVDLVVPSETGAALSPFLTESAPGTPSVPPVPASAPVSEPVPLTPVTSSSSQPAPLVTPVVAAPPLSTPPSALPVADIVFPTPVSPVPTPTQGPFGAPVLPSMEPAPAPFVPSEPVPLPEVTQVPLKTEGEINPTSPRVLLKNLFMTYRYWLIGTVSLMLLLALAWFGWRWYRATPVAEPPLAEGVIQAPLAPAPAPAPEPVPTEPSTPHYSIDQPNLISFDTETVTADAIKTELLQIALSIQQDNLQKPVEFFVRDQKYNPLAFTRFAYLLNMSLAPELLAALDEEFSLFFVMDQVRPRIGLIVKVKNVEAFNQALPAGEATLPKALEPVFLDITTAPKSELAFRSGLYRDQPLRFANVDSSMNLSIDYAVRNDRWIIGTSQTTLRALLDRP